MMTRLPPSSWHQVRFGRRMIVSKLFLSVGALAFGGFIFVSGTHAAVRVGDFGAISLISAARTGPEDIRQEPYVTSITVAKPVGAARTAADLGGPLGTRCR